MRKIAIFAAFVAAVAAAPARADSLAVAGSASVTGSQSHVQTSGLSVGVAAGAQANVSQGVSLAATTPVGPVTVAAGQSNSVGASQTFTAGVLGGTATAQNAGQNFGVAGGVAFAH